ncbi:MFS transporter [Thiotrichales bacterium 19S3-7]|nr:MFS transporter [Thiotrichales bacterium 19S3-7]MCF6801510.1 MFS transporter [Thiotrichales bacterium 19S3-11]
MSERFMPKGVLYINAVQTFSTVGFAVLLGTLNLYLQSRGMPVDEVNILVASFFALNFLLHFLGGSLGGSMMSFRGLFTMSLMLQIFGLIGIAMDDTNIILGGMALFLTGSGLNVSCVNMMLIQLFKQNDERRRIAFSINYSCMNLGFIIGFIIGGYFQSYNEYSSAFYTAAVCLVICAVFLALAWRYVNDKMTYYATHFSKNILRWVSAPLVMVVCFIISVFLMHHANIGAALIYIAFALILIFMILMAFSSEADYRNKIIAYLILSATSMIFAFVQGLQSTGIANFVKYNTNLSIFGFHFEQSTVNMFESLGVIIFGLFFAIALQKQRSKNQIQRSEKTIAGGLGIMAIAFMMIPIGIYFADKNGTVQLIFPALLLFITAASEIRVNSTNYSLPGELGKPKHQGLFTGYLFLNVAMGINLSGPISNAIIGNVDTLTDASALRTNPMYMKTFIILTVISLVVAVFYYVISKWLKTLMTSKNITTTSDQVVAG